MGLMLALTLLVSFMLVFAAQTEAVAQAAGVKEKVAKAAEKANAQAQTSQVKVTTEGSGQTSITVNGQEVKDDQNVAQEDEPPDGGASASAGGADADAGDLTCEQIAIAVQYARERGEGSLGQYIDLSQNCDIRGGDVIADTIPDGTLADTGGPSPTLYGALALGLVLVGGGALLFRSLSR